MSLFRGEQPILGTTVIQPSKGDDIGLTIQATDSGQTASLLSLKNSAGTVVASISNAGVPIGLSARNIVQSELLAASVDKNVFIADRAYTVKGVRYVCSVVGGASAAVKVRKITDTSAPGAAAGATVVELTTAALDLTSAVTANTVTAGTLSATAADLVLAAGNRIALDFSGTLTGLVGYCQVELQPS